MMGAIKQQDLKKVILTVFALTLCFIVLKAVNNNHSRENSVSTTPRIKKSFRRKEVVHQDVKKRAEMRKEAKIFAKSNAAEFTAQAMAQVKKEQKAFEEHMASELAKKEFQKGAFLKMEFPPEFKYREVVTGVSDTKIVYGVNKEGNSEFSVIASERTPTRMELLKLLKRGIPEVPNIGSYGLRSIKELEVGKASAGSGISQFTLLSATNAKGQKTYLALAPRSDKQGTYLFVLSADQSYIEKNEGVFEELQQKIQALSP